MSITEVAAVKRQYFTPIFAIFCTIAFAFSAKTGLVWLIFRIPWLTSLNELIPLIGVTNLIIFGAVGYGFQFADLRFRTNEVVFMVLIVILIPVLFFIGDYLLYLQWLKTINNDAVTANLFLAKETGYSGALGLYLFKARSLSSFFGPILSTMIYIARDIFYLICSFIAAYLGAILGGASDLPFDGIIEVIFNLD